MGTNMIEAKTGAASATIPLTACRLCGSSEFVTVLNLGEHALTGVFPASTDELISRGQLELL